MLIKFIAPCAILAAALAGCESTQKHEEPPPPQEVTPGSTFTVTKDFLIPSGNASVYFQDTQLYPLGEIQGNNPYCKFIMGAATAAGKVIKGTMTVSDVDYDERGVDSSGASVSISTIHLKQASSGEPYRMDCMLPLLSPDALFVTPAEIQGALGGYMDLKVLP